MGGQESGNGKDAQESSRLRPSEASPTQTVSCSSYGGRRQQQKERKQQELAQAWRAWAAGPRFTRVRECSQLTPALRPSFPPGATPPSLSERTHLPGVRARPSPAGPVVEGSSPNSPTWKQCRQEREKEMVLLFLSKYTAVLWVWGGAAGDTVLWYCLSSTATVGTEGELATEFGVCTFSTQSSPWGGGAWLPR